MLVTLAETLGPALSWAGSAAIYLAAFVFVLTIVVFFHELGHFTAARVSGVRVDAFSIGFGPKLISWRDGHGTQWRISLLPLGGYVKFFGDQNAASAPDTRKLKGETTADGRPITTQFPATAKGETPNGGMTEEERAECFHFKPVGVRAFIVAAGPLANFILATVIFAGLLMGFGERVYEPRVGTVLEGSAAEDAGLQSGDLITAVNGRAIERFKDLQQIVLLSSDEELSLTIERGADQLELIAVPQRVEREDAFGNVQRFGTLGIQSGGAETASRYVRHSPASAFASGAERVASTVGTTFTFLGRMITGREDAKELGGPLRIAQFSGQTATAALDSSESLAEGVRYSLIRLIELAGFLSVSIGLINLFPIPMLDGGHLMYYGYEAVAGQPLGERAQAIGFRIGLALLLSLMAFATWNDLNTIWF